MMTAFQLVAPETEPCRACWVMGELNDTPERMKATTDVIGYTFPAVTDCEL